MSTPLADSALQLTSVLSRHGPALRRVVATYARDAATRADVYQEVCLALCRALPGYRGECSERTFAFRIAHNVALAAVTRGRAQEARTARPDDLDALPHDAPDPERALDASQRRERLYDAIRELPLSLRQPLSLALEGMSHEEVAQVLGIAANNVSVRIHRAREALRTSLGEKT